MGGRLWHVTWKAADLLSAQPSWQAGNGAIAWTKLFKSIGIDGVVDNGDGIIHPNEPTQAVFFRPDSIINNARHHNDYSPDDVIARRNYGQLLRQGKYTIDQELKNILSTRNHDEIKRFVSNSRKFALVKLTLIPKDILLAVLEETPSLAERKPRLPEYIQDFLIQNNPENIKFIRNPTELVQKKLSLETLRTFDS